MKKLILFIIGLSIFFTCKSYSFPLKHLKKNDKIDIGKLVPVNVKGEKYKNCNEKKIVLIWRHDKRLSKKTFKKFIPLCGKRKLCCISIDLKKGDIETIKQIVGNTPNHIYFAQNVDGIKHSWGIFTLPVTIFLDKNNRILDAIGYEGEYIVKVARILDLLEGKITKKELEKIESSPVDRRVSLLPDLNFILELINSDQPDDALEKLEKIKERLKKTDQFETFLYVKILIKLKNYDKANKILERINKSNIKYKFYKAVILYKTNKLDKALDYFKKIEMLYPDKKAIYYHLGKIYKQKGNYKNATDYFEKAFNYINIDF